jgi:CubicO group peptidase (beta-lactamase class C family)
VSKYIPEFADPKVLVTVSPWKTEPAKRPITIRQLLTHTSGLATSFHTVIGPTYQTHGIQCGISIMQQDLKETMTALATIPLVWQPGERWEYSISTDLLGYVIETISGMPLDRFIESRVCQPLGMNDTHYKNVSESKRVGKAVRAKSKQCYKNSMRVIRKAPEYNKADYVEGYAVIGGNFCIEHGWVEQDGVVIDPTLHDEGIVYFPGLRFTGHRGIAEAMDIPKEKWCEDLPIFFRFGWGGIESPEFRAAIVAAYRYAGLEDTARRYESYGQESVRHTTAV